MDTKTLDAIAHELISADYIAAFGGSLFHPNGQRCPSMMRWRGQYIDTQAVALRMAQLQKPLESGKRQVPVGVVQHRPGGKIGG